MKRPPFGFFAADALTLHIRRRPLALFAVKMLSRRFSWNLYRKPDQLATKIIPEPPLFLRYTCQSEGKQRPVQPKPHGSLSAAHHQTN